ncbi:uncharacterized protein LOC118428420 [Branchiostoma floridae]|uniref:Uncharacterized protein LOC118428420 n=1 Tax=Branchiostoma floridae TaxID=7739 RepID=A0A9J7M6D9_BRAFL|nr:uncharacterized protein LOC118428420 [Branchiostoma floridae]
MLIELADSPEVPPVCTPEERLAWFQKGLDHYRRMIKHAENQVQKDAKGKIVERPERLANLYNTTGKFLLTDKDDSTHLQEAIDWFLAAYNLEKQKGKEDYPLRDALFGLAEGLKRRNQSDDLRKAMDYVCELLELCHRKWPDRKDDIERAEKLRDQI